MSLKQSFFYSQFRGLALSVLSFASIAAPALSQGVPHLSVDKTAYHTLVAPGTLITSAMCAPSNAFCLAAVGKPLVGFGDSGIPQSYVTDSAGNIFVADAMNQIIYKIAASGRITILAGEYGVASTTYPALAGPAASTILNGPSSITIDSAENLYVVNGYTYSPYYGAQGSNSTILKIDTAGVAHRLTDPKTLAIAPTEGALASSQYVLASSIAAAPDGDLYLEDVKPCVIRLLSAKTGTLNSVVGSLAGTCSENPPVNGAKASTTNLALTGSVAVGADGTLYFTNANLYSVTNGTINALAYEGPSQTAYPGLSQQYAGSIGYPNGSLVIDLAGNAYFPSIDFFYTSAEDAPPFVISASHLVEVTKGTVASPSQILILSTGASDPSVEGQVATLNPEGMPSNLVLDSQSNIALDPFGRIIMTSQDVRVVPGKDQYGIAYFDRDGAIIFNNSENDTKDNPAAPQTVTLTNSGSATLKTVNVGTTGFPYYFLAGATNLYEGIAQNPIFTIDQTTGTCLALYAPTKSLTLQPGESCTLTFDYKANAAIPPAGSFTLDTNDPLGPLTVTLNAYPLTATTLEFNEYDFQGYTGTYYDVTISSTTLKPSSSISSNGSFSIAAAVASSVYDPTVYPYYPGLADVPVTPTGRIYAALTNNVTGKVYVSAINSLDAEGHTTFSVSGLPVGTYSLAAAYLGDGKSAASFSNVQTLTVTK